MKVTMHDIETHHPDREMPPLSRECAPMYWQAVASGEQIAADCDRDLWLNAEEMLAYGLIDSIVDRAPAMKKHH